MTAFSHLLVPIDFTEASLHALDYGLELAGKLGARVTVTHVYHLPAYDFPDAAYFPTPEEVSRLADAAGKHLDAIVASRKDQGVPVTTVLRSGNDAEEICALAKELAVDLIVMGTHGRGAISTAFVGSTAQKVIRMAPVPVITLRGPKG
jgi:nucleotide-binding universal stress UspA family protein